MKYFFTIIFLSFSLYSQNWQQASGPNLNYQTDGKALSKWSLSQNKNIKWKVTLPEGGQSTPIIWGDKLFLSINKPVENETPTNDTIIAMCFNKNTGELLWQKEIKGHWAMRMNAIFSDATVCSPVTDGKTVCFSSPTGIVVAFDFDGNEKWRYTWQEGGGYNIRQHEPFIIDGKVFVLVERNETFKKPEKTNSHKYWGRRKFIRCLNLHDGKIVWDAEGDSSPHYTSMPAKLANGKYAIYTARGGGHNPPEKNHGFSLINVEDGKELLYSKEIVSPIQNLLSDEKLIYLMTGNGLKMFHNKTGKLVETIEIYKKVSITEFDGKYKTSLKDYKTKGKKKDRGQTEFTNIIVGDYFFFMANTPGYIGRVNLKSKAVEYIQVPLEIDGEKKNWLKHTPPPVKNSRGIVVKGDGRSSGAGWGHLGAIPPTVIGDQIYFTTMPGTVYVLKWNSEKLDASSLLSVNSLGPVGKTWTLAGFSYSEGKLYTRTLKELICIGE